MPFSARTSRHSLMASLIFFMASFSVFPWLKQPGMLGHSAINTPSSSLVIVIRNFIFTPFKAFKKPHSVIASDRRERDNLCPMREIRDCFVVLLLAMTLFGHPALFLLRILNQILLTGSSKIYDTNHTNLTNNLSYGISKPVPPHLSSPHRGEGRVRGLIHSWYSLHSCLFVFLWRFRSYNLFSIICSGLKPAMRSSSGEVPSKASWGASPMSSLSSTRIFSANACSLMASKTFFIDVTL